METLILNLSPKHVSKRVLLVQRLVIGSMGFFNLLQGLFKAGTFRYVNLLTGIGCLLIAIRFRYHPQTTVYSFTDAGIERPEAQDGKNLIPWSEVAFIEHTPLRLTIGVKNGHRLEIDLGSLSYEQHQTIKPQIRRFAESHNVELRTPTSSYHHSGSINP